MPMNTRRKFLKRLGAGVLGSSGVAASTQPAGPPKKGSIRKIGHSLLSNPPGGFAEEAIRSDGRYALIGGVQGPVGSYLVDIRNPVNPREVHTVPSASPDTGHWDVKFDYRDGLYYRSLQFDESGFEVIDYGFEEGTPANPVIRARADAGPTHNLFSFSDEPLLYTDTFKTEAGGFDVWDVSNPSTPVRLRTVGVENAHLHDIVVDPERALAHCAYFRGSLDGYVIMDVSDPTDPVELGRFDYAEHPDYSEVPLGEEAFENCHLANYDPERNLSIVGDEVPHGKPGGKHVFDISDPTNPKPIGYTLSPNAERQDEPDEGFDWTGHNFDVIPKGNTTLLVSGDYAEGTVVYDITDPTGPTPVDQYRTVDKADQTHIPFNGPPNAWGADYNDQRDIVVTSDVGTGFYTFKVTQKAA